MTPKILIFHTLEWSNAARMALAFREAGCAVYALCRRKHPLRAIRSLKQIYTYKPLARIRSLREALIGCVPDLIVPCDDRAVVLLHRLYWQTDPSSTGLKIRAVIKRSLGRPDAYRIVSTRSALPGIATLVGIRIPATELVSDLASVKRWFAEHTGAVVLKSDHSWGGWGVRIAQSLDQVERAFRSITGWRRFALAVKLLCRGRDPEWFLQLVRGHRPALTVQRFIRGRPANCSVACWNGEVLAGIAVEALVTKGITDSATVVRVIDNHEMMDMAASLVRHVGATGIFGFDFILEEGTGLAFLLEINPRATQISHLAVDTACSLPAAICAKMLGKPIGSSPTMPEQLTVAFFPQELRRDPTGSFLEGAYHDVPSEEPALVAAFLAKDGLMQRAMTAVRTTVRLRNSNQPLPILSGDDMPG
jgi:hypothetical protein